MNIIGKLGASVIKYVKGTDLYEAIAGDLQANPVVKTVGGVGPDESGNVDPPEGVTSWNDLEDRPFGEETEEVTIFENFDTSTGFDTGATDDGVWPDNVRVVYNGIEYTVSCTGDYTCLYGDYSHTTYPFTIYTKYDTFRVAAADEGAVVSMYTNASVTKLIDEAYIPDSIARVNDLPAQVVPTWEDLPDKPFGESYTVTNLVIEQEVGNGGVMPMVTDYEEIEVGAEYIVKYDGVGYRSFGYVTYLSMSSANTTKVIGYSPTGMQPTGSVLPFCIYAYNGAGLRLRCGGMDSHTISVYKVTSTVPIPETYIPSTIARTTDIPDAVVNPATASIGQTIVVKDVDESGKPIEWEAVDLPTDDHINALIAAALAAQSE